MTDALTEPYALTDAEINDIAEHVTAPTVDPRARHIPNGTVAALIAMLRQAESERDAARVEAEPAQPVTEYAVRYKSGDWKIRYTDDEVDRIYPLAQWISHGQRFGGFVGKRTVIVVEDWKRVRKGAKK